MPGRVTPTWACKDSLWRGVQTRALVALCAGVLACTPAAPVAPTVVPPTPGPTTGATSVGAAPATAAPAPKEAPKPAQKAAAEPDAAKMAEYFSGKTIDLYIPYGTGGYDIKGRIFAEFFPKYVPGNPKIAVTNMPGGGGLQATRHVMRLRPDGLSMVVIPAGIFISELLGEDMEGFEVRQPLKLGNYEAPTTAYNTLVVRTEAATSWDEVVAQGKQGRQFRQGAEAVGTSQALTGEWLGLVGAPIAMVYGYGGASETLAALDRGEIDMYSAESPAATREASFIRIQQTFPAWLTSNPKFVTPVLSVRTSAPQAWFDSWGYKAPPNIMDVVSATDLQKDAYRLAFKVREAVDPLSLPPGVPDDIYQTLKRATREATEDPGYKAAMLQRGFEGGYRSPEELDEGLTGLENAPKEVVDIVRRMYTGK